MLARKEMRQVDQRITARYHLYPLSRAETADYIRHRLAVAGVQVDLFSSSALRLIHRLSGGVPRRINTLCERALLAVFATDAKQVGIRLVWRAAREIKGRYPRRRALRWVLAGLFLLGVGLGAWWILPATEAEAPEQAAADTLDIASPPRPLLRQLAAEDEGLTGVASAAGHLPPVDGGRSQLPEAQETTPSLAGGIAVSTRDIDRPGATTALVQPAPAAAQPQQIERAEAEAVAGPPSLTRKPLATAR